MNFLPSNLIFFTSNLLLFLILYHLDIGSGSKKIHPRLSKENTDNNSEKNSHDYVAVDYNEDKEIQGN